MRNDRSHSYALVPSTLVPRMPPLADDAAHLHERVHGRFVVHVRAFHAIDLPTFPTGTCPTVCVAVGGSGAPQSCMAAQHAKSHSAWKRHALSFTVDEAAPECSAIREVASSVSLRISLSYQLNRRGHSTQVEVGSVGELRLPLRDQAYAITRFFPLFRQTHDGGPVSLQCAVPAGKIKIRISCEPVKVAQGQHGAVVGVPSRRPLFGSPGNFLDNLQLQRKKLRSTVVPVSAAIDDSSCSGNVDSERSAREALMKDISDDTATHAIDFQRLALQEWAGEGIHSCVRRAKLTDHRGATQDVAMKEFRYLHEPPPLQVLNTFRHEYRVLSALAGQGAEYVPAFLGVVLRPKLAILTEFCNMGRYGATIWATVLSIDRSLTDL